MRESVQVSQLFCIIVGKFVNACRKIHSYLYRENSKVFPFIKFYKMYILGTVQTHPCVKHIMKKL